VGDGSVIDYFLPGNAAPCLAYTTDKPSCFSVFQGSPGGGDVFRGGLGANEFRFPFGTGSNTVIGLGPNNTVSITGNLAGRAEEDYLMPMPNGAGVEWCQMHPSQFDVCGVGIQHWQVTLPGGYGNIIVVRDLTGTATTDLVFSTPGGFTSLHAAGQENPNVTLTFYSGDYSALFTSAGQNCVLTDGHSQDYVVWVRNPENIRLHGGPGDVPDPIRSNDYTITLYATPYPYQSYE
jgi:hypothetical protein